jgi:hypothetical protein
MIDGPTFLRDVTANDAVNFEHVRMAEALLFAAEEPLDEATLAQRLPEGADIAAIMAALTAHYAVRGVTLVTTNGRWWFRTSADLAPILNRERQEQKKLSRAALETLAIVAYHQGDAGSAPGNRLGTIARPSPDAGPSGDVRHHADVSRTFRTGNDRRSAGRR